MKIDIGNFQKYPKKRKIKVKIHDSDVYDFRSTMAIVIVAALKKFKKKNNRGTPLYCFPENSYYYCPSVTEETAARNEWNSTLDKMIFAFEELSTEQKEFDIINKNDYDTQELIDLQNQVQEGLDLFAKHYRQLWI